MSENTDPAFYNSQRSWKIVNRAFSSAAESIAHVPRTSRINDHSTVVFLACLVKTGREMTSIVKFTSLLGAHSENPLCSLLEIDNYKILLDCGPFSLLQWPAES